MEAGGGRERINKAKDPCAHTKDCGITSQGLIIIDAVQGNGELRLTSVGRLAFCGAQSKSELVPELN